MEEQRSRGNRKGKGRNEKKERREEERKKKIRKQRGREGTIVLVSSRQYLIKK